MESFQKKVEESAQFLEKRIDRSPEVGVLVGTGLGSALTSVQNPMALPYGNIPHFPVSTVITHKGQLLSGKWADRQVLAMQGRFHFYEGFSMEEVTLPVRVMQLLGVKTLIVTNASGGITPVFSTGDIMMIEDHINLTGNNPLVGPNVDAWGPRFPDMMEVYSSSLMTSAEKAAREIGVSLQKGVYAGLGGPSLETRAEIRFLKTIGADAVGLSTIPEVIAAKHGGVEILGLSVITNVHDPDDPKPCSVKEIIATAESAAPRLGMIIASVIEQLP